MQKKSLKERLAIFSAGPFSNIALAALLFLIYLFVGSALAKATLVFEGVEVTDFIKDANTTYPAELAGMSKGEIITKIDGMPTQHIENFTALLKNRTPGSVVQIESMKNKYNITLAANPLNSSMPYLGVYVRQNVVVNQTFEKKYGSFLTNAIMWFNGRPYVPGLMYWLIVLNLGIGLFNLIPIGPIDGGRMMHTVLHRYLKKEKAEKIARFISSFFLMLILINLAMGFFVK